MRFILFFLLLVAAVFTIVGNRRRGIPLLRIYEDRIEYKLALQIQLTNLDKPVDTLYKLIVERIEL